MAGERGEEPNGERVKSMAEGEMREVGEEGLRIKRIREGASKTIFSSPYLQVNCKLLHAHQLLL